MADIAEVFDELTATTQRHRNRTVTDNVTQHNLFLRKMADRGNRQVYGGSDIVEPLGLVENSTITNIAEDAIHKGLITTKERKSILAEFDEGLRGYTYYEKE